MKVINKKVTLILVIIWMLVVFLFSSQVSKDSSSLSKEVTKLVIEKFNLLDPMNLEEFIIEIIARKFAHYLLYTIGGILILLHINLYRIPKIKKISLSLGVGTLYAITDEIHQLFVQGRSGEINDVLLDSLGIFTGITILLIIFKFIEIRTATKNE